MDRLLVSTGFNFELIGYLAAFLVLISFVLKDIKWIRIINIFGGIFWIIYGILIASLSNIFMNIALIIVHIFYLNKMRIEKKKQIENNDKNRLTHAE